MERIYRETKDGAFVKGLGLPAFIHNGDYFCVLIKIYEDGLIDCWDWVDFEGFVKKVRAGWVVTRLPENTEVNVSMYGSFHGKTSQLVTYVEESDFITQVKDALAQLQGKPTTKQECFKAFITFLSDPTEQKRNDIREKYESVPDHLKRTILGDMDDKDYPIKYIIENEIVPKDLIIEWIENYENGLTIR